MFLRRVVVISSGLLAYMGKSVKMMSVYNRQTNTGPGGLQIGDKAKCGKAQGHIECGNK
jgi:hypothetical protein